VRTVCDALAVRTVGTQALCAAHVEELLEPIRERVYGRRGIRGWGRVVMPRADCRPGWGDLQCGTCGATWVGPDGDPCAWCERHLALLAEAQAEIDARRAHEKDGDRAA
jgi:hypothetical protein